MVINETCEKIEQLSLKISNYFDVIYVKFLRLERSLEFFQKKTAAVLSFLVETGACEQADVAVVGVSKVSRVLNEIGLKMTFVEKALPAVEEVGRLKKIITAKRLEKLVDMESDLRVVAKLTQSLAALSGIPCLSNSVGVDSVAQPLTMKASVSEIEKDIQLIETAIREFHQDLAVYQHELKSLLQCRKSIAALYLPEVNLQLDITNSSMAQIGLLLTNLLKNANSFLEPGRLLMAAVQKQDIIRQGFEHSIALLRTTKDIDMLVEDSSKSSIAVIAALYEPLKLANSLLMQVGLLLNQTLQEIGINLNRLLEGLEDVAEDGCQLNNLFCGSEKPGLIEAGVVDTTVATVNTAVNNYFNTAEKLFAHCSKLVYKQATLNEKFKGVNILLQKIEGRLCERTELKSGIIVESLKKQLADELAETEIEHIFNRAIMITRFHSNHFQQFQMESEANRLALMKASDCPVGIISLAHCEVKVLLEELYTLTVLISETATSVSNELKTMRKSVAEMSCDFKQIGAYLFVGNQLNVEITALLSRVEKSKEFYLQKEGRAPMPASDNTIFSRAKQFALYLEGLSAGISPGHDTQGGELTLF